VPNPTGPSGSWTQVFGDDFDYTGAPDPTKWASLNGYAINGTSCLGAAGNSTVAGGILYLTVASATSGAYLSSNPLDGAGVNGWAMPVGGCVEARIYSPGPDSAHPWNWGVIFASGQDWPANGEADFWEINGSGPSVNYHYYSGGNQQSGPFNPSGNWANAWHTSTLVRTASTVEFWWDGALVKTWTTDDSGGAWSILPLNGAGNTSAYGIGYAAQIDYVYGWVPAAGPSVVQNVALPGASSATISADDFTTTAGNTLILEVGCWSTADSPFGIAGITDSAGNDWAYSTSAYSQNPPAAGSWDAGDGLYGFCALASCIDAAAIDSVTVVFTATDVNWAEGNLTEVTGLPLGSVVLAGASADAIATGVTEYSPPSVTVASPGAVLAVALSSAVDAEFTAASGGFTILNIGDTIGAINATAAAGTISTELSGSSSCNVPSGAMLAIGAAGSAFGLLMAGII